jgi:glycosyltransferase involved in cell wall biosynthesis
MKTAIIEIGGSHDECLYSQLLFLKKAHHDVDLYCSQNLYEQVKKFDIADNIFFLDIQKGFLNKLKNNIFLWKKIRIEAYEKVIFNTAQGNSLRDLMLFPFSKKVEFIGLIHNANKLLNSFSQKLISRKIKKYFVLNDYLLPVQKEVNHIKISSFYPIFFPNFEKVSIQKPDHEIWICIPGQIQQFRRNYKALIHSIDKEQIPNNINFILLGKCHESNDCQEVKELIKEKGLENHFRLWTRFISNEEFHTFLSISDYIMPLVNVEKDKSSYLNYKISGSFNLAFAHKKPLIMDEIYENTTDFKENAIFYNWGNSNAIFDKIQRNILDKPLYQNEKWSFTFQQKNYIDFLTA